MDADVVIYTDDLNDLDKRKNLVNTFKSMNIHMNFDDYKADKNIIHIMDIKDIDMFELNVNTFFSILDINDKNSLLIRIKDDLITKIKHDYKKHAQYIHFISRNISVIIQ